MNPPTSLAFAGVQYDQLRDHLFPGDNLEAAAILLCSRATPPRVRLIVRDIILVPYDACQTRRRDTITWPGDYIEKAIDRAELESLTLVLIHSHPGGLFAFSAADDKSDQAVMPSLIQSHWDLHCSAIMTPNGAVRARFYTKVLKPQPIDLVTVAGHDILYWWDQAANDNISIDRPMAFTSAMSDELGRLTAMVVGASGTGSILAEQVSRLGFGHVKLVDFDVTEQKNLNRVLNSTLYDAQAERLKVEVLERAIVEHRGKGVAESIPLSILSRDVVIVAGQCDVLFCGVDSLEARQVADLIAAAFLVPLFDVGVVIPVRNTNGVLAIGDVCGRIDYIQPGQSTLQDRGVYSPESLRAEYLLRNAPTAYDQELKAGYIKSIADEAPAVISLNMRAAAACINEFIARAYPFRHDANSNYARTLFSLAACEEEYTPEVDFTPSRNSDILGRGSLEPLLGLPFLGAPC